MTGHSRLLSSLLVLLLLSVTGGDGVVVWSSEATVTVEVSSAAPDSTSPTWVDLTSYVRTVGGRGGPISISRGRQNELSRIEPSRMSLVLDNGAQTAQYTASDTYTRSVSNGWGTADVGGAWTTSGGSASDFSVDGSRGVILLPTGDTASRSAVLPSVYVDVDVRVTMRVSAVATGANLNGYIRFRHQDSNNYYRLALGFDTGGTVDPAIAVVVASTGTTLVSASNVVAYSAGSDVHARVQAVGTTLRAKVWSGGASEPNSWLLTTTDATYGSGQAGVRAVQSVGNTNTDPTVSFDDFTLTDPYAAAGRFTSGYVNSPFYPWWKQARKIRVRETLGARTFDLFTGYVEIPDVTEQLEGVDNLVRVNAVDRLGRLGQSRSLVSVVAEEVLLHAGSALRAYWPMGDVVGPWQPYVTSEMGQVPPFVETLPWLYVAEVPIEPAAGDTAPADDLRAPQWAEAPNYGRYLAAPLALALTGTDVLTMSFWVNPRPNATVEVPQNAYTLVEVLDASETRIVRVALDDLGWFASASTLLAGPIHTFDRPVLVTCKVYFATDTADLWIGFDRSITNAALTTTAASIARIQVGGSGFVGAANHVQVYVDDGSTMTGAVHDAQYLAGLQGQNRERTGDRVNRILDYAGVPAGERAIDQGESFMQPARLAGRKPDDALTDCVDTERGRLFVAGDGKVTFHDRRRVYDI